MFIQELDTNIEIVDNDITFEFYAEIVNSRTVVSMDIETSGLDPKADRIATIQVYVPNNGIEIVRFHEGQDAPSYLRNVLENVDVTKIFHYAHFDLGFLMQNWPMMPRNIKDTRVAATLLDPHRERFWNPSREAFDHGLAALVWHYYKLELDKSIAISDWFGVLEPKQIEYAARDVLYLPDLLNKLTSELKPYQRELAESAYQWIPTKTYLKLHNLSDPTGRA